MAHNCIDWSSLFDEVRPEPGASEADILGLIEGVTHPVSQAEIEEINAVHRQLHRQLAAGLDFAPDDWSDPSTWELPRGALPQTYLDFLRWSNGGAFRKGTKWFNPIFKTDEVRGYTLSYELPEWMPGALPFAFDGGGTFYVFDMRQPPQDGEYPVLVSHAGNLGFDPDNSVQVGATFLEACQAASDEPWHSL